MINSYPSVFAIGHKMIADLFKGSVIVEEKIDGSQFSMGIIDGELMCRSKGKNLILDAPEKMFMKAVETANGLGLHYGYIYRCEYLQKPKHNTLAYDRVPKGNLIIYDIQIGLGDYLSPADKAEEAARIGLECVPLLFEGKMEHIEMLNSLFLLRSILGGSHIEGVVVKNYELFTKEKKIAIGKYVSEKFKEIHGSDWKKRNPGKMEFIQLLIEKYCSVARWEKAIQHKRDEGLLEHSPRDIGMLIKEIPNDVLEECEDEIKEKLFKHFWPIIRRGITRKFPEYYKQQLAESAFEEEKDE
jgi:hypothetical protein